MTPMKGLTPGRMVHFVMPDGQHRPAVIVKIHDPKRGNCNLQVFTDGLNDREAYGTAWKTSINYSDSLNPHPGTWHWIEPA